MNEHQSVEWKESWRDEYLRWICGFANAQGGTLVIGRNDRGEAVGVRDADRLLEQIPNKVRDLLGIVVEVNLLEEQGKALLEVVVEPYPTPVSYRGEYHYRSGSTKQELKGAALDRFLLRKQGRHWDGVPVPGVNQTALVARALNAFRAKAAKRERLDAEALAESDAALLEKLHLTDGTYLKRAGVLLFHPDPERFVTGAYVKIGYFRDNVNLLFQDDLHGDLFSQIDRGLDLLLTKYSQAMISYDGIQRIERFPVPPAALREALLNAIAHKDYGEGAPIQISVHDDKIIFWNPGQLPSGWTVDRLFEKHPAIPHNPDIANVLFRAGLIEAWGRGIETILHACAEHGLPMPEMRTDLSGFWLQLSTVRTKPSGLKSQPELRPESQPESQPESLRIRIIELLEAEPLGMAELSARLGQKTVSGQLKKVVRGLLADRCIEFTIPHKPQSRLQRYRLTPKGMTLLASMRKR